MQRIFSLENTHPSRRIQRLSTPITSRRTSTCHGNTHHNPALVHAHNPNSPSRLMMNGSILRLCRCRDGPLHCPTQPYNTTPASPHSNSPSERLWINTQLHFKNLHTPAKTENATPPHLPSMRNPHPKSPTISSQASPTPQATPAVYV
jgi:hypothetical protein